MSVTLEANSPLAISLQEAIQPKLVENGWVAEETDATLAEYITMMLVNGKTEDQLAPELSQDLLGIEDPDGEQKVKAFVRWLFEEVKVQSEPPVKEEQMNGMDASAHDFVPAAQDAAMSDAQSMEVSAAYVVSRTPHPLMCSFSAQGKDLHSYMRTDSTCRPSGPKAMRNGSVGQRQPRDNRMLSQVNKQLSSNLPDPLKRIKGAASGQTGRINSHTGREPPKGPRNQKLANGMNRMMNSGPRGMPPQGMPMMNGAAQMNPQQTMQLLQMMEQQSAMLAQMLTPGQQQDVANGKLPSGGYTNPHFQPNGNHSKSMFDRLEKSVKRPRTQGSDAEMQDSDSAPADPENTPCKFKLECKNPACPYAHQSPATTRDVAIDMSDTCTFGAACKNYKCTGKHPSPAKRNTHLQEVECRFQPNCTNPKCPFKHSNVPPCKFGADCTKPGCPFLHSKIECRYNPCTNAFCQFKHAEGQKRGKFEDKVWTAENGEGEGFDREAAVKMDKTERFAGLKREEGAAEELILPGSGATEGIEDGIKQEASQVETQMETQIQV